MSGHTADLFHLQGRTAIVTGGAGMLGQRHAEAIADMGGIPVLLDLPSARLDEAAQRLADRYKAPILGVPADITRKEDVERAVGTVIDRFQKIDILINNAAFTGKRRSIEGLYAPFEEYPLSLWREALDVNLTGTFLVTQAVGKAMRAAGKGVVLNIASDVALVSPDHRIYQGLPAGKSFNTPIAYSTTKAALLNFTRHLATYWASHGIRVNALCPAGVFDDQDPQFVRRLCQVIPLGRMASKDEYKGTIVYLVSDASAFMTGSVVVVDGGRTSW